MTKEMNRSRQWAHQMRALFGMMIVLWCGVVPSAMAKGRESHVQQSQPQAQPQRQPQEAGPATLFAWWSKQHTIFHRYLNVLRQAVHDYGYNYKSPPLIMPISMDLFTGYIVHIHQVEEQVIYPALRAKMNAEQQATLNLIEHDQQSETQTVTSWQQNLATYEQGGKITPVVNAMDELAQFINRHVVLQEDHVFSILDTLLTPKEQQALLKQIAEAEGKEFAFNGGRSRYEQLLAYMEDVIKNFGGRVW